MTLRLPAGLIETEAEVAPEAADVYTPVEPLSENGAVAPIGNGFGKVTVPLNVTFWEAGVAPVASRLVV